MATRWSESPGPGFSELHNGWQHEQCKRGQDDMHHTRLAWVAMRVGA